MQLLPSVQMTPALSSWTPLIRLERAAGMWRTLWRRMVQFWCGYWLSSRTVPRPMARAERIWPKPFTVRGGDILVLFEDGAVVEDVVVGSRVVVA
jgi:hypothetical protein